MEIGLEPKVNNIDVKPVGKKYEINFGDEVWIYLGGRKELTELRDKINSILIEENSGIESKINKFIGLSCGLICEDYKKGNINEAIKETKRLQKLILNLIMVDEEEKRNRNKINDVLMGGNNKSDMLREKQDYEDEVKLAGGKVE